MTSTSPADETGPSEGTPPQHAERVGPSKGPRRRRWVRVTAAVLAILFGYYMFNLVAVWRTGAGDEARPVDAIVVLGAAQFDGRPSPEFKARLDHVVELWNRGLAPLIVVTGGKLPGDRFTEAQAAVRYLTKQGVPDTAFLAEDRSHNTYDQLVGVRDLLHARNLKRVLLVSDPYHMLRAQLIAEEVGLTAYVSATRTSTMPAGRIVVRHLKEAGGISLGRIISFKRLTSIVG
ncbi:MAG TPA: YdcF family protein [Ilumatobacteraceae bacterium]|nr:YdcF family protein [Ilumatobacteraceae bacterium]